ncbi:type IV pili methyl-accepting chemotaxis transducer N-terminal domain-containing protein [Ferrimonas pelagia]|uniref:Sensor protein n=1 Tax=Ferrimonas pelagia TaxID=1177826 RepID=A0ABP9EYT7_9GAMM
MKRKAQLSRTVILTMLLVIACASLQAGISLLTTLYSVGDGRAINDAGSLRMRAYQMVFLTNAGSDALDQKIAEFEQILDSPNLVRTTGFYAPTDLREHYLQVTERWQRMRGLAQSNNSRAYVREVKRFVADIDDYVLSLERFARFKLMVLALIQAIGILLMSLLTFLVCRYAHREVIVPLRQLEHNAEALAAGKFTLQTPPSRFRELSTLGHAISGAGNELEQLYQQLERKVESQDRALQLAHQRLSFLYETAHHLHSHPMNRETLQHTLDRLRHQAGADSVALQLSDEAPLWSGPDATQPPCLSLPLPQRDGIQGTLALYQPQRRDTSLLQSFLHLLSQTLQSHRDTELQERLALMEERAVIARELHDSLGQLLAYMKIQLTLLQRATASGDLDAIEQTRQSLKGSVDNAYSQLRELLSTFRLKLASPDLPSALSSMLEELQPRSGARLSLDYQLPPLVLSAPQQVHLMQLLREAVVNAIKHADASTIQLSCFRQQAHWIMSVSDNGIGMQAPDDQDGHFGLGIMQERARNMGGQLSIQPSAHGGVDIQVRLPITAESQHDHN